MMAVANNPDRSARDEADIVALLLLSRDQLVPDYYELLDRDRIYLFADRFGQRKLIEKCFDQVEGDVDRNGLLI